MECCTVEYFYEDQLTKGINSAWMMSHTSHTEGGTKRERDTHRHKEMDRQKKTDEKQAIHTGTQTHTQRQGDR